MCVEAPESITNSRSSGDVDVGAGVAVASSGEYNVAFSAFFLSLYIFFFRKVPRCFADASFLLQGYLS